MAQVTVWCDVLSMCLGCKKQYVNCPSRCCGQGFRSEMKVFSMCEKPEVNKLWFKKYQIEQWERSYAAQYKAGTRSC